MGKKSNRRGHGEGSVYQRKDGTWCAALTIGYNAKGNPDRKVYYGTTQKEATDKRDAAKNNLVQGLPIKLPRRTVGEFLDQWVEDVKRPKVRISTYLNYKTQVDIHLKPALGRLQLTKLEPEHIQKFLNEKLGCESLRKKKTEESRKLSARSVKYLLLVLRMALKQAVKWKYVPSNVALLVDPPAVAPYEVEPIDVDEALTFLNAIEGHRHEALFAVALAMGLRRGEALALQWKHVDLQNGTLRVRQSLSRVKGSLVLGDVKRKKSRRDLDIPNVLLTKLQAHRRRQLEERLAAGSEWQDTGFVFTTRTGSAIDPRNMKRELDAILKHNQIRHYRIHDLRHFYACLLLLQGVELKVVSELLGHTNTRMTDEIYTRVLPALKRQTVDLMDRILTGKTGT